MSRPLNYGKEYVKQSLKAYEQRINQQNERSLPRQAEAFGYQLVEDPPLIPKPIRDFVPAQAFIGGRSPAVGPNGGNSNSDDLGRNRPRVKGILAKNIET